MSIDLLMMSLARNAKAQSLHFQECIGQHLIAAYLHQRYFEAKVFYGDILQAKQTIVEKMEHQQVRIFGFYVGADNVTMVSNLILWLKSHKDVVVFVGGPQAMALGEDFLRCTGCDYIIPGEGEIPVYHLLQYLLDGIGTLDDVESIIYLDEQGTLRRNPLAPPIMDLDSLPFPRREDSLCTNFHMGNTIGILTGRGCPFHCAFCFEGAISKTVRLRSIENVIAEIDDVLSYNPNLHHINIYDDTFTLSPSRVSAFCREIKKRGLTWTCEGHVSCLYLHPEMLEEMVESGLVSLQLGIESGSQKVLNAYNKKITPEHILAIIEKCKEVGVRTVEGNYILGGPFETEETIRESIEHALSLIKAGRGMLELNVIYLTPYHGTPIALNPERYGLTLIPERAEHVVTTMMDICLQPHGLSEEQLVKAKIEFEKQLKLCYEQQAKLLTKDDFHTMSLNDTNYFSTSVNWYLAIRKIPHLLEFIGYLTKDYQIYAPDKYPIRVGSNYLRKGDTIIIDDIELRGPEARVWLYSDGKLTVKQLATSLELTLEQTEAICFDLNHRCLMYFSEF